jgi:HEAT repeat protein
MNFIPIKKIQKHDPVSGEAQEKYAVPSVAIATQQGRKLIPNPAGNEASLFDTLEEAEEAIRRAGFDYEFEGKRTYTLNQQAPVTRATSRRNGQAPLDQAIPILIQHLQDREASVVSNAAYALGTLKSYAALDALTEILGHDDPGVRKNTAEAMARLGAAALPKLREAFEKAQASHHKQAPYIRLTVLNAFLDMLEQPHVGTMLSEQFLPLAVTALEDESWLVRSQAALVIGRSAQAIDDEKKKLAQQRANMP